MINQITIEGIVVRTWKYLDDLFVRVASYRDPDLPGKPLDHHRDAPDYINVRLPGAVRSAMNITQGMHIRVHGYLQSRDYSETLEDFLRRAARTSKNVELDLNVEQKRIKVDRSLHEVVMQRMLVLEQKPNKKNRPNARQLQRETGEIVVSRLNEETVNLQAN